MTHNFVADKATLDAVKVDTTDIRTVVNAIPTGDRHGKAVFTANGTFTVPVGISWIYISACAAGVAGTNTGGAGRAGDGGNGGEYIYKACFAVTPGQAITITVGSGNTVIGSFRTLIAGKGLKGGIGTTTAIGLKSVPGESSAAFLGGTSADYNGWSAGGGAASLFGGGGDAGWPGAPGTGYGSGGGACYFTNNTPGAGAPGVVIIEW